MGALATSRTVLPALVASGGSFTLPYPTGSSQAHLTGSGGNQISIGGNNVYAEDAGLMAVSFGATSITVTNTSGETWRAGEAVVASFGRSDRRGTYTTLPADRLRGDVQVPVPGEQGRRFVRPTLTVAGTPLSLTGTAPDGTAGAAYTFTPTKAGGSGTASYRLEGSLLAGFSFNATTGAITATAAPQGAMTKLRIIVTDDSGTAELVVPQIKIVAAAPVSPISNRYMFAATRVHPPIGFNTTTSSNFARFSRTMAMLPDYSTRNVRLVFTNWNMLSTYDANQEVDTGNPLTIDGAAVELADGTILPVTFGGASTYTIADGGFVISDPLPGPFAAGAKIYSRIADSVVALEKRPAGWLIQPKNGEGVVLASSKQTALVAGGATPAGTAGGFGPASIIAQGWDGRDVALLPGDSVGYGQADNGNSADARGVYGFMARGLDSTVGGRIPYQMFAFPASRVAQQRFDAAGAYRRKLEMLRGIAALNDNGKMPFTAVTSEHGINDSSSTAASMQTEMQGWWDFLRTQFPEAKIVQATYPPRASSTDLFTTLANQSPVSPNNSLSTGPRATTSAIIRNLPAPLTGFIDSGPLFADPSEPLKWAVRPFASTFAAAAVAGATSIQLANAPALDESLVFEPGDATNGDGAINYAVIGVSGSAAPYTVTLSLPLAKGHAQGAVVRATSTQDNLHPSSAAHVTASAAVITAKTTGGYLKGTAA